MTKLATILLCVPLLVACGGDKGPTNTHTAEENPPTSPHGQAPATTIPSVKAQAYDPTGASPPPPAADTPPTWEASTPIRRVRVRADGSVLALTDNSVSVVSRDGTQLVREYATAIGWSPDGEWIVGYTDDKRSKLSVWKAGDEQPTHTILAGAATNFATVSAQGSHVATTDRAGKLALWNAKSGELMTTLSADPLCSPLFLDASQLAVMCGPMVQIYDAGDPKPSKNYRSPKAWFAAGWRVWTEQSSLVIARADGPAARKLELGASIKSYHFASPVVDGAGKQLAVSIQPLEPEDGGPFVVVFSLADGAVVHTWRGGAGPLSFSPDGKQVVVGLRNQVRVIAL